jgi:hypothetical protein
MTEDLIFSGQKMSGDSRGRWRVTVFSDVTVSFGFAFHCGSTFCGLGQYQFVAVANARTEGWFGGFRQTSIFRLLWRRLFELWNLGSDEIFRLLEHNFLRRLLSP